MTTPISIVIPAFNQLDYCRQCVTSLLANTEPPYKLILVDNGSTDGVSEYFDSVPDAVVVHTGQNLGFARGINRGLEHAEGHALLLNSDTLLPRGWLGRMRHPLEQDEMIGMIGPRSNCVSGCQQIDGLSFTALDEIERYADTLWNQHGPAVRDVTRLVGFCMLIRDRVVREVGVLDERFGIGNFEDDDYGLRVLGAGYRLCMAEGAFVFHYGSRTFAGMGLIGAAWNDLIRRNSRAFQEKWRVADEAAAQRSRARNREGRAAAEARDAGRALRSFRDAIEADPGIADNYNDLGAVLWSMGEQERAYDLFARAVRLAPDFAAARDNLRDAAKVLQRDADAQSLLDVWNA